MQISVKDLAVLCDKLLTHLQELNLETIELPQDYYWDVPDPDRYAIYTQPDLLTVGQLSDDLADLTALIESGREPVVHNFVDLAAIFRAIGEQGEAGLLAQVDPQTALLVNGHWHGNGS